MSGEWKTGGGRLWQLFRSMNLTGEMAHSAHATKGWRILVDDDDSQITLDKMLRMLL